LSLSRHFVFQFSSTVGGNPHDLPLLAPPSQAAAQPSPFGRLPATPQIPCSTQARAPAEPAKRLIPGSAVALLQRFEVTRIHTPSLHKVASPVKASEKVVRKKNPFAM